MSLITGCPKLIPFHYRGRCQTESGAWKKRCEIMNQQQLYDVIRQFVPSAGRFVLL